MIMMAIALPVMFLLIGFLVDLGGVLYQKSRIQSAADAAAIGAVKKQTHIHVPIPDPKRTIWIGPLPIPLGGWFTHGFYLNHLQGGSEPSPVLKELASLNADKVTLSAEKFPPSGINGVDIVPWPVAYVEITARGSAPLHFSKILPGVGKTVNLEAKGCALAWVRPDYWWHDWYSSETGKWMTGQENLYYYRKVACTEGGKDFGALATTFESLFRSTMDRSAAGLPDVQGGFGNAQQWGDKQPPKIEPWEGGAPSQSDWNQALSDQSKRCEEQRERFIAAEKARYEAELAAYEAEERKTPPDPPKEPERCDSVRR
ncbi:MAG: TadE/TadG family type IV pilus assembly protein [Bacillota bacterium]